MSSDDPSIGVEETKADDTPLTGLEPLMEATSLDPKEEFPLAKRIAILGNVDAGKSTMVGCLTRKIQDNGRGYARQFSFGHAHELDSGRTSDISIYPMGFDKEGNLSGIRAPSGRQVPMKRRELWTNVNKEADSVALLIDLCGHERYFKSTCKGVVSQMPHYAMLLVAANKNPAFLLESGDRSRGRSEKQRASTKSTNMTRQHLGIIHGMHIPFFIVVTKIDLPAKEVFHDTMSGLATLLRRNFKCEPKLMRSEELVDEGLEDILCKRCIEVETKKKGIVRKVRRRIIPIFAVSSVTGEGMPLLTRFLYKLPTIHQRDGPKLRIRESDLTVKDGDPKDGAKDESKDDPSKDHEKTILLHSFIFGDHPEIEEPLELAKGEVGIDAVLHEIAGTAVVVTGIVYDGLVEVNQEMLLGPDSSGSFVPAVVRSIEVHYEKRNQVRKGEMAGFGLRLPKKHQDFIIRKGMFLTAPEKEPQPTRFFMGAMTVLHHSTTMRRGCVITINVGPVQRSANVVKIMELRKREDGTLDLDAPDLPAVATGDRALFVLKFKVQGGILHLGDQLALREGTARGIGYVVRQFKSPREYQRYRDKGSSIWAEEEAYLADVEEVSRKTRARLMNQKKK